MSEHEQGPEEAGGKEPYRMQDGRVADRSFDLAIPDISGHTPEGLPLITLLDLSADAIFFFGAMMYVNGIRAEAQHLTEDKSVKPIDPFEMSMAWTASWERERRMAAGHEVIQKVSASIISIGIESYEEGAVYDLRTWIEASAAEAKKMMDEAQQAMEEMAMGQKGVDA